MAGKFLSMDEAASQLGISTEHLRELTQKYEVNGLRDGANFKYKPEEIERAKAKLFPSPGGAEDSGDLTDLPIDLESDGGDDIVLLSEVELGESGPGTSATVIGPAGGRGAQEGSDISIFTKDSDLDLAKPGSPAKPGSDLLLGGGSELGLDLGSALSLEPRSKGKAEDSGIDLSAADDDDDLVLSGPGASDITLSPGDSGISLGSPADSGLSLDEPLDLKAGSSGKDFDLAGDDLLSADDASEAQAAADDEFLLTPSEELAEDDSDASGSQVIVIDSDSADFTDGGMLEEDTSAGLTPIAAASSESFGMGPGAMQAAAPVAREAGYSGLQITSLSICVLFLCLCGMMMIDITRNMWAWNSEIGVNSAMADTILDLFGG